MPSTDVSPHEIRINTAEEYLTVLTPRADPWHNNRSVRWVFRGQPCTSLRLIPKAWREDHLTTLGHLQGDASGMAFFEARFLSLFLEGAHRQGLRVPGPAELLEKLRTQGNQDPDVASYPDKWPDDRLLPALALAQHYGVPTRLLDWTYRPYVAAYFGAMSAIRRSIRPERVAVWCLNSTMMHVHLHDAVRMLPVTSDGNPNLAAQRGAFTLYKSTATRRERADLRTIDEMIGTEPEILRCYSLPFKEVVPLLLLLRAEGVDGSALFPGFGGAAAFMLEAMSIDAAMRGGE